MNVSDWSAGAASGSKRGAGSRQTSAAGHAPAESHTAWRYLAIVATMAVLAAVGFTGVVQALSFSGRMPPPAFSNSYCFDAKLAAFRQKPPVQPTHLIIGSSIPWRNIATETIIEQYPQARPLNAGFCGLQVNQSAFVGRFFLQRYPTVTDVLLLVDPFDMGACRSQKTEVFDSADVSDYLSGASDLQFYFKYFDLVSLTSNAFNTANASSIPFPMTRLGDGPLIRGDSDELVYGPPPIIQPACVAALAAFAHDVEKSGRRLVVVTMPLLDAWSVKYDSDSQSRKEFAKSIEAALAGTSATFWDGWSEVALPRSDYFDAVHLHWRAVPSFTRQLVQATRFGNTE